MIDHTVPNYYQYLRSKVFGLQAILELLYQPAPIEDLDWNFKTWPWEEPE